MARPTLRLRAVVSCDGRGCDVLGEVLLDPSDLSIDLNTRSIERDPSVELPLGWSQQTYQVLCPKCSAGWK